MDQVQESLVTENLNLVHHIAKKYQWMRANYDDMVSAGNEGLIQAALKFDTAKQVKFSTYAFYWIRAYITKQHDGVEVISLNAEIKGMDGLKVEDTISAKQDDEPTLDIEKIFLKLKKQKHKDFIILRFGFNGKDSQTLEQIAKLWGVTKQAMEQLEKRILKQIKQMNEVY